MGRFFRGNAKTVVLCASLLWARMGHTQKIYHPSNQEFGAPLTEQDWKALRAPSVAPKPSRAPASVEALPANTAANAGASSVSTHVPRTIPSRTRTQVKVPAQNISVPDLPKEKPQTQTFSREWKNMERAPAGLLDTGDGIRTLSRSSSFRLAPLFFYSTIDAQKIQGSGSAALLSNFNYGGEVEWKQSFSSGVSTHLGVRVHRLALKTDTNVQTQSLAQTILGLNAGLGYAFTSWVGFDLQGMLSEELFIRADSMALLNIDKVFVPQVRGTLWLDLFSLYPFELGVSGSGILMFPKKFSQQNAEVGKGYRATLYIEENTSLSSLRWFGNFFYEQKNQQTNLMKQVRREYGIELGIHLGESR